MQPKERYLPVEVDLGSAKARVRIKVRENETAADIVKRIKGIEVEETRMGAYIKRINLQELLFKNKDVVVDYVSGDIKSVDEKKEQWIQVYVDGGLPVIAVNNEAVGLGISNFSVGSVRTLTIKDEEKIEKYTQDFSYSDAEAIINCAISNNVSVSCPGGIASAELSRKVFDVFLILKEDGVVGFYDGCTEKKPLGWMEWVFPEKGMEKKHPFGRIWAYDIKVAYLVGPGDTRTFESKKKIWSESDGKIEKQPDYYCESKNYGWGRDTKKIVDYEEQKTEKIDDKIFSTIDLFDGKPKKEIKKEHPALEKEKHLYSGPKILAGFYTSKAEEYVLFDGAEEFRRPNGLKKKKTVSIDRPISVEQQKQNAPQSHDKLLLERRKIGLSKEFFAKKVKPSLLKSTAEKEGMRNRGELEVVLLKEKIQNIKIKNLNIKMVGIMGRVKRVIEKISNMFLHIKLNIKSGKPAKETKEENGGLKFLAKSNEENTRNKKKSDKDKRLLIVLLLEKWFPKIKKVKRCYS